VRNILINTYIELVFVIVSKWTAI